MQVSDTGRAAIEEREGCRLQPYQDEAGYWTIGFGHLLRADELATGILDGVGVAFRAGIARAVADSLLTQDLAGTAAAVTTHVTADVNQGQFDTLASFAFNIGEENFIGSGVLAAVNTGKPEEVPSHLALWNKSGRPLKVDPVLVSRRLSEIAQWKAATG